MDWHVTDLRNVNYAQRRRGRKLPAQNLIGAGHAARGVWDGRAPLKMPGLAISHSGRQSWGDGSSCCSATLIPRIGVLAGVPD
jgi:hypothetical protein